MSLRSGVSIPPDVAERCATQFVVNLAGCHISTYFIGKDGYARISFKDADKNVHSTTAHRAAHQHHFGIAAADNDIDHLCHDPGICSGGASCPHRPCVRGDHLAEVTREDNRDRSNGIAVINRRKSTCPHCGGPYDTWSKGRGRYCRDCKNKYEYHRRLGLKTKS